MVAPVDIGDFQGWQLRPGLSYPFLRCGLSYHSLEFPFHVVLKPLLQSRPYGDLRKRVLFMRSTEESRERR